MAPLELVLHRLAGCSELHNLLRLMTVLSHSHLGEVVLYKLRRCSGAGRLQLHLDLELILQYKLAGRSGIRNLQLHLVVMAYLLQSLELVSNLIRYKLSGRSGTRKLQFHLHYLDLLPYKLPGCSEAHNLCYWHWEVD
jgi:hypothetical protein